MRRPAITFAFLVLAASAAAAVPSQVPTGLSVSAQDTGDNIYEVTISGREFTSRDAIEAQLLRETAQLALRARNDWFLLLPMPSETPGAPSRAAPPYGAEYASWHVQWNYKLAGQRWQCWRPEWGAPFWADGVDRAMIVGFEANALVKLATEKTEQDGDWFEARTVLSKVRP